jgi:hypothetical protein
MRNTRFQRPRYVTLPVLCIALLAGHNVVHCAEIRIPLPDGQPIPPEWQRALDTDFKAEKEAFASFLIAQLSARVELATDNWEKTQTREKNRKLAAQQFEMSFQNPALATQNRMALALNPALLQATTAPRLNGRVLEVGPGKKFKSLAEVAPELQAGDVISLSAGTFDMPENIQVIKNLLIHGKSAQTTTLRFARDSVRPSSMRARFENLTINCNDSPFLNCRDGGTAEIAGCHVYNYNSGAGGSEAIFGENMFVFVTDSEFEGMSGKDASNVRRAPGNAFDVRNFSGAYVTRTSFIDNSEIARPAFIFVLDHCTRSQQSRIKPQWSQNVLYPDALGSVFTRETVVETNPPPCEFTESAADFDVVMAMADPLVPFSENSIWKRNAKEMSRNLAYWIALLRHQDPDVRKTAATRLRALTGEEVAFVNPEPAENQKIAPNWKELLDAEDFATRMKCIDALRADPSAAWPLIRELVKDKNASQQVQSSARELARTLPVWMTFDADPSLACEKEYTRMSRWLDDHAEKLIWNEAENRYTLKP